MKKSTLIVCVVFLALAAGAIYTTTRKPERGISRISFSKVDTDSIDAISVKGPKPIELKKVDDVWQLADGKPADANAIKRLVESVAKIKSSNLATRDESRFAELEVDEEKGTQIRLSAAGKVVAKFVVGKSAAGGAHVRTDDGVYQVQGVYQGTFARESSAWLERKLFTARMNEVKRVEVKFSDQKPYALLQEAGKWKLEDDSVLPKGFRFDGGAARRLVSSLVNLRAKDIVDDDPGVEKTGLGDGADTLTMEVGAAEEPSKEGQNEEGEEEEPSDALQPTTRYRVQIGLENDDKAVYLRVDGRDYLYTLAKSSADNLRKAPTDFRDLKFVSIEQDKIKELTIKNDKGTTVLAKKDSTWELVRSTEKKPEGFTFDATMVQRRLSALASARGTELAPAQSAAAAGLTAAKYSVTAKLDDGNKVRVLFGKEVKHNDQDRVYAGGNADDAIYLVTPWTRNNLTGGLTTFKKREQPPGLGSIDPKALGNLPPDVRQSLMKQMQQKKREQEMLERIQKQMAQQKQ